MAIPGVILSTGHSRVEKATSEVPALLAGHTSGVRRKPTHERDSATPVVPNRAGTRPVRQGKPSGIGPVVCKGQRIGRCPEPCDDVPAWGRAPGGDWPRRVFPPRHATAAGRAPARDAWAGTDWADRRGWLSKSLQLMTGCQRLGKMSCFSVAFSTLRDSRIVHFYSFHLSCSPRLV